MTGGKLRTWIVALVSIAPVLSHGQEPELADLESLVEKMRNNDIRWDFGTFGVSQWTTEATEEVINSKDERYVPFLVSALRDEERFAAAYFALIHITDTDLARDLRKKYGLGEITTGAMYQTPNRPGVSLRYDASNKDELHRKWNAWRADVAARERAVVKRIRGYEGRAECSGPGYWVTRATLPRISNDVAGELSVFERLDHLQLSRCRGLSDEGLHRLAAVSNLRVLDVTECDRITDRGVGALKSLPRLEMVVLDGCPGVGVDGLRELAFSESLTTLSLRGCTQIPDGALEHLVGLERLCLAGCSRVGDAGLEKLSRSTSLRELDVSGCPSVGENGIQYLGRLKSLEALTLDNCSHLPGTSLRHLENADRLRRLSLAGWHSLTDDDLSVVARMGSLQELDLSGCQQITGAGLKHLRRLRSLNTLRLNGLGISGDELRGLQNLRRLELRGCPITDKGISAITSLGKLQFLDLSDCDEITAKGFRKLRNLKNSLTHLKADEAKHFFDYEEFRSDFPDLEFEF